MFRRGEQKSSDEKSNPPHDNLSPADSTAQELRASEPRVAEGDNTRHQQSEEFRHLYNSVDRAWEEYDRWLEKRMQSYRAFQESEKQLTLSEQKLEHATIANTDEERQKTYLGKIAKYAEIVGGGLMSAPIPPAQVIGLGVAAGGISVSWVNAVWTYRDLQGAKREHEANESKHKKT